MASGGFPFSVLPGGGVGGRSGSMSPLTGSRHKLSATAAAVLPPGSSAGAYNPHEPLAGLYSPKSSHVQLTQPHKSQLQPVVHPVKYQDQSNVIYGRPSMNTLLFILSCLPLLLWQWQLARTVAVKMHSTYCQPFQIILTAMVSWRCQWVGLLPTHCEDENITLTTIPRRPTGPTH